MPEGIASRLSCFAFVVEKVEVIQRNLPGQTLGFDREITIFCHEYSGVSCLQEFQDQTGSCGKNWALLVHRRGEYY